MEFFRIFGQESSAVVPTSASGINDVQKNGFTRLQSAVLRCEDGVVKSLIEGGADCNGSGSHGRKPIFLLADYFGAGIPKKNSDEKRLKILSALFKAGANPSPALKDHDGFVFAEREDNLCQIAAKKSDPRFLLSLLKHNFDSKSDVVGVNVVDRDGLSAIQKAAVAGNSEVVDVFLVAGCNFINQENLDRALNLTCRVLTKKETNICGKWKVVESLIKSGANSRWIDKDGVVALSILQKHHCERGIKVGGLISPEQEASENEDAVTYLFSRAEYESKVDDVPSDKVVTNLDSSAAALGLPSKSPSPKGEVKKVDDVGKDEVWVYDI